MIFGSLSENDIKVESFPDEKINEEMFAQGKLNRDDRDTKFFTKGIA